MSNKPKRRKNHGPKGNARRVAEELTKRGPQTRSQLAGRLEISTKTLKGALDQLISANRSKSEVVYGLTPMEAQLPEHIVEELGGRSGTEVLMLGSEAGKVVGIEIGYSHLSAGIGDPNGCLLGEPEICEESHAIEDAKPADTYKRVAKMVKQQMERCETQPSEIRGVAVSIPGPVGANGETLASGVLAPYAGVPIPEGLAPVLQKVAKLPSDIEVFAENDVDVLARGEQRYGKAFGLHDFAVVKCSSGIGSAIVSADHLVRGKSGGGVGEIGHCPIRPQLLVEGPRRPWDDEQPKCRCGCWGHLEAYAGGRAVVDRIESLESGKSKLPTKVPLVERLDAAIHLAVAEDGLHRDVIVDAARLVGVAVNTLVHLFNPPVILISGKLSEAGDLFLDEIRRECTAQELLFGDVADSIQPGTGSTRSERRRIGIRGAVTTALRRTEPRLEFA